LEELPRPLPIVEDATARLPKCGKRRFFQGR
jgi:hypothetical protein